MRIELIERVRDVLARAGFYLSAETKLRPVSFDVVARRDGDLLIVKVLTNVDSLSEAVATEIRVLADFLDAQALLVGERSSSRAVEPGAVYVRHGIPIMTVETLAEHLLEGTPPLVYAAPGGFYVNLDGVRLRQLREERGLSLGQLADAAGVSRRAISMYEEGMGAMVDVAARLEEFLNEPLILPVDPLHFRGSAPTEVVVDVSQLQDVLQREVFRTMEGLGFRLARIEKGPFQGVAKVDEVILTAVGEPTPDFARRAHAIANLAEVTESFAAFFVERHLTTRATIEGLPLVTRSELERLDDASAVMSLLEERRKKTRL